MGIEQTHTHADEAKLWQVLGMSFLAGGGVPLGLNMVRVVYVGQMESDALRLGVWFGGIILLGFCALVLARVLNAKDGVQHEHLDWIWTVLAWAGMPLGAAIFDFEWSQSATLPSLDHKAMLLAGAFVFMTGVISLVGERTVNRIQCSAIKKSLNGVTQHAAERSEGPTS
jgi:hypothetical protein